ncbi:hypothetical protein, partial [Aeromonas enteropelogenes]|uniref:hypothetical protein n=1 Tax=Aeromonas enteropelogenes TaxID=29489 RepID=UPI001AE02C5C
ATTPSDGGSRRHRGLQQRVEGDVVVLAPFAQLVLHGQQAEVAAQQEGVCGDVLDLRSRVRSHKVSVKDWSFY